MAIDLTTLLAVKTAEQIYDDMLSYLSGLPVPLPIANWRTGGPYRTLLRVGAHALEKLYTLQVSLAEGGYLAKARKTWLTVLAEDWYGETRQAATCAAGDVVLTAAPGAGPYTLSPSAVIVSTPSGLKYRTTNTAPLTLPAGGSVTVPVKAVSPGAVYNVGGGAISRLDTPTLLGVSAANSSGWQTAAGADEETDEKLRLRCATKWGTLGTGSPAAAYVNWALGASPEITRVSVYPNRNDDGTIARGILTIVLGGAGSAISDAARDAAKALIDPKAPVEALVKYKKSSPLSVTVGGVVYVPRAYLAQAPGWVQAGLDDLQRTLPQGQAVYLSALIESIHTRPGDGVRLDNLIQHVDLTSPPTEVTPGWAQFPVFVNTLTFVGV